LLPSDKSENEVFHKLSLLYRPGSAHLTELLRAFDGNAAALADLTIREPRSPLLRLNENERIHAALFSPEKFKKLRDYCYKKRISLIDINDENYPQRLREIYNPPILLYAAGDITALSEGLSLAIVGARDPSDYSRSVTAKLVRALQKSEVKWTVVSGLARGIDITAHTAAIRFGAKTVAVKGCGVLFDYPKQNAVYADIIKKNGVIISEYPPDEPAKSMYFPVRNRIIAGMSAGTLVVEASEKSGSLVTANLAAEFGRDVFCVPPHDITSSRYFGNVNLLRDGATPLFGVRDLIFENINTTLFVAEKFIENDEDAPKAEKSRRKKAKSPKLSGDFDGDYLTDESDTPDTAALSGEAKNIAEKIITSAGGLTAEDISLETDLDVLDIIDILTDLEINGFIRKNADGRFLGGNLSKRGFPPNPLSRDF
jgi:DNA processing protein